MDFRTNLEKRLHWDIPCFDMMDEAEFPEGLELLGAFVTATVGIENDNRRVRMEPVKGFKPVLERAIGTRYAPGIYEYHH